MGNQIVIIGAGPAGFMAAISAAGCGASVILLEKMSSPGRKLLITGSGRCNISNAADINTFIEKYSGNGKFLFPAFHQFFRPELLMMMQKMQIQFITEGEGKIFPASGESKDILNALLARASQIGVTIHTGSTVDKIILNDGRIAGVSTGNKTWAADAVVLSAGGSSYALTGSSGDSFSLATGTGHTVIPVRPALVPFVIRQKWLTELKGISLMQVKAELFSENKCKARDCGDLLITHFGLSGPVILRLSRYLTGQNNNGLLSGSWQVKIDLLPQSSKQQLTEGWKRQISRSPRQHICNVLTGSLPSRMMPALMTMAGINPSDSAATVSQPQLDSLAKVIKGLMLEIDQTRGFKEAMVTAGGINLKEVNPKTMESKLVKGLFFAGEALDIDGDTGGYNLQAAFSTGWLAGKSAAIASNR